MITSEMLQTLTTFTAAALSRALAVSGHKDNTFLTARFLGMTNANQFCYSVTYTEHNAEQTGKVFLNYDSHRGVVTADF